MLLLVAAMMFYGGLQVQYHALPNRQPSQVTIGAVTIQGSNDVALLPIVFHNIAVDYNWLPYFLQIKPQTYEASIDIEQSQFVNAFVRNPHYAFTSIHAP